MSFLSLCFYSWQFVVFIKHTELCILESRLLTLESCPWNQGSMGLSVMFSKQRLSIRLGFRTQAYTIAKVHVCVNKNHTLAHGLA